MQIRELGKQFFLITDSHQVAEIRDFLHLDMQSCDSLFARLDKDDDAYEIVYGFEGIVPLLDKTLTLLFRSKGHRF
jgi:hypothetical protein